MPSRRRKAGSWTPHKPCLSSNPIAAVKALGGRVILFVDPDATVIDRCRTSGADGVEVYTGHYAAAFRHGGHRPILEQIAATARAAQGAGLVVNAGHDLNLRNIPPLYEAVPFLPEASIGHELDRRCTGIWRQRPSPRTQRRFSSPAPRSRTARATRLDCAPAASATGSGSPCAARCRDRCPAHGRSLRGSRRRGLQ